MKRPFKSFIVNKDFEGSRVDRFLKKQFPDIPQSLFEKNLRKKNITVNNKKVKSLFKLKIDDIINIYIQLKKKTSLRKKSFFSRSDYIELRKNFIFECDDYCILNKPYGYASQDGSKVKKNVIDILNINSKNYYIVHRLDKETSGLMLIAKNRFYAKKFSEMFKLRDIKKKYLVIVNLKERMKMLLYFRNLHMLLQNFCHIGLQKIIEIHMDYIAPLEFYLIMSPREED